MANLNKVFLIGRLTRDPDLRYTPAGQPVATFRLAVTRQYVGKEGRQEETCFVNVVVWGKRAQVCSEYLKKGAPVFVEGRLASREWETQDKQRRSTIEVVLENFQFLERAAPSEVLPEREAEEKEDVNDDAETG
mgnify:CR=1 FL=1